MSSTLSQVEIARENHTLPTRRSAYQDNGVSSDPFISKFLPLAPTAVARPAIPQAGSLLDAFDPSIANALSGIESPVAALNAVADDWKQLLAGSLVQGILPGQPKKPRRIGILNVR
jgi:arabinogalactan oligomer/maltooligosaccharide transport system substrate-binding protein